MSFETCFQRLLVNEGGYSNNPNDPGGETMWGITASVARQYGYTGAMNVMPQSYAETIYRNAYWAPAHCDELPGELAFETFDAAVNSGVAQATKWLQQAVGVPADGVYGPQTRSAVQSSNPDQAASRLLGYRLNAMVDMGGWLYFGKGWARRIATNLIKVGT